MTAPAPVLDPHNHSTGVHTAAAGYLAELTGVTATPSPVSVDNLSVARERAVQGGEYWPVERLVFHTDALIVLLDVRDATDDEPAFGTARIVQSTCVCGAGLAMAVGDVADLALAESVRSASAEDPRGLAGLGIDLNLEHLGPCPLKL